MREPSQRLEVLLTCIWAHYRERPIRFRKDFEDAMADGDWGTCLAMALAEAWREDIESARFFTGEQHAALARFGLLRHARPRPDGDASAPPGSPRPRFD